MRSLLVLLAVFFLHGHSLRAGESASAPAATNPDLDREQDGLTNHEEMLRSTNPNASDSDSDSIPDPDDAVGNDPAMRVPAALETTYAIIDLGSEYQPAGVNDRAEVLLLKPGGAPETESAVIWKNGTLIPVAEGRKDSFRGPFLNGDVCFGTPDTTSAVTGGNQTISENKRWASATQTISAAGLYYEHHALTTAPGIPYPGTAPQMSVMTTNVRGTAERLLAAMKARIDPQLVDYYVVPEGTHHQDYGAEMHWTNDLGFNTFSAWTNTGQEITKAIDGIVLPPISLHARMVLGGYVGKYDWESNSFGAIAWQGVAIPSQPPGDLRINMSQFMVATMDGTPTVISPINGSRQPIPGAESLADLNNKTTPEGPYILGSSAGGVATIWCHNAGEFSSRTLGGYLPQPSATTRLTNRTLSNRLVVPLGDKVWRNGTPRTLGDLCGSSAEDYQAWNIFQVSPNAHHLLAEALPAAGGTPHALLLVPADIAVDANRDGVIRFSGNLAGTQGNPTDRTTEDKPFRFWLNDDCDLDTGELVPVFITDAAPNIIGGLYTIGSNRDLEDFTRLWLYIGGLQDAIAAGTIKVGLKWKNTEGSHPSINVYRSAATDGSDGYLKSDTDASAQMGNEFFVAKAHVAGTDARVLPTDVLSGLGGASPSIYFLFEGVTEGKGELCITFHDSEDREIGEGPGVWVELLNVKKMYQRGHAVQNFTDAPFAHMDNWSPQAIVSEPYDNGNPFSKPADEEKKAVIYVHGINGPSGQNDGYATWQSDSETAFKRLWHQGFKGRFATFKWLALTPAWPFKFNESEYRGWKCGEGLAHYISALPDADGYTKNLYSFSQGAIVCGAALRLPGCSVKNYVMSQAAAPAGSYDTTPAINSYTDFLNAEIGSPTPDAADDLGYRGYLSSLNVTGSVVSFYNQADYALKTGRETVPVLGEVNVSWEGNQLTSKPNQNLSGRTYAYDSGPPNSPYVVGQRCFLRDIGLPFNVRRLTDIHESMSFVARPRSEAAGASNAVEGKIGSRYNVGEGTGSNFGRTSSDHGGQFSRRIQQVWPYYENLLGIFTEE